MDKTQRSDESSSMHVNNETQMTAETTASAMHMCAVEYAIQDYRYGSRGAK